jgi:hypothetical protein
MAGDLETRVRSAAEAVLTDREQVEAVGECWAAQCRSKVPLLFLGRRQYHVALTDRRVLVFARRRGGPDAADLILGKRYHTYEIEKVRRGLPHFQVRVRAQNGNRMVFEFRRNQRKVAQGLVEHLEEDAPISATHIPPITALLDTPASTPAPASPNLIANAAAAFGPADAPLPKRKSFRRAPKPPTEATTVTEKPPKDPKVSRKERRRLAREDEERLDEPPDASAQAKQAAGFWDTPT